MTLRLVNAVPPLGLALAFGAAVASPTPLVRLGAAILAPATFVLGLSVIHARIAPSVPSVSVLAHRDLAEVTLLAAVPAFVLLNSFDIHGFFLLGSGLTRYLVLLPFLLSLFYALTVHKHPPLLADGAFFLFVLYALIGVVVGLLGSAPLSSGLPLVLPAVLAFAYIGIGTVSERECAQLLRILEFSLFAYVLLHLSASQGLFSSGVNRSQGPSSLFSNGAFTHEKVPLLLMALHLALRLRRVLMLITTLFALCVIYLHYPAGTYAAAASGYLAFIALVKWRRRALPFLLGGIVLVAAVVVVQLTNTDTRFAGRYFSQVGKTNNVATRILLWKTTEREIRAHPVFGSSFAGEATVRIDAGNLPPRTPPHNDYLEILLLGGGVALTLFLWKLLSISRILGRTLAGTLTQKRRVLIEVCGVGIVAFLIVFIFNPVLLKVSLGGLFFSLVGLIPSLCSIRPGDSE